MTAAMASRLAGAVFLLSSTTGAVVVRSLAEKKNAIDRVLTLLEEMQAQMQKEQKADAEGYDKMVCWCETTEAEKRKAIADADDAIDELESLVQGGAAEDATLATNIEQLKKDIGEKKAALDKAAAIREKEAGSFRGEEKDLVQALTNVKNAIMVLKKHQSGLIQMTDALQDSLASTLRWVATKHQEVMTLNLESTEFDATRKSAFLQVQPAKDIFGAALRGDGSVGADLPLEFAAQVLAQAAKASSGSFVQGPKDEEMFNKKPGGQEAYNSQSGQIFGILKQMTDDFESNLSQSQKDEVKAADSYAELKAMSEKEIEAMKRRLDKMEGDNSATVKALSDAKENLQLTREQRSQDVKFLSDLRLQCQGLDRQWEQRSKARMAEITAVSETMDILTSDDARDLFARNYAGSFLQLNSVSKTDAASRAQMMARSRAARVLLDASKRLNSHDVPDFGDLLDAYRRSEPKPHEQLRTVAVMVQLDAFSKIKEACDKMINDLKAQQEQEVKLKATCSTDLNINEKETYTTSETLKDIKDKIEALEETIEKLQAEIEEAQKQMAAIEIEVKKASLLRKQDNQAFQLDVNDERAVQKLLGMAIERMKEVYKSPGGSLLQKDDPVSPVQFKPTKKNAGGSPVASLMEQIIEDSKQVEKDAEADEQQAQENYSKFVNDSAETIDGLNQAIAEKTQKKVAADSDLAQANDHEASTQEALDNLHDVALDLHEECDFTVQNFDIRQKARLQEIESIQKAKAYLSGMKDSA